jgi:hypothetical protein
MARLGPAMVQFSIVGKLLKLAVTDRDITTRGEQP